MTILVVLLTADMRWFCSGHSECRSCSVTDLWSDFLSVGHFIFVTFDWYCLLLIFTGPPNGPVLFCLLASVIVVVVCNAAGGLVSRPPGAWAPSTEVHRRAGRSGGRHCMAGQYGYVPLGQHLVLFVYQSQVGYCG